VKRLLLTYEQIGTIGDALSFGPTQLEVDTSVDYDDELPEDSQKDAVRKLMNRVKFGADSVMYFPFIFGGSKNCRWSCNSMEKNLHLVHLK
jgi:hypothetical protein